MMLLYRITLVCFAGFLIGCISHPPASTEELRTRSFHNPREAVSITAELLRREKWQDLAAYYDLSGSGIDRRELESGRFFLNDHPILPPGSKIREPFSPEFTFDRAEPTADPLILQVYVTVAINEGGGMVRRGVDSFFLRHGAGGYMLLPRKQVTVHAPTATS